MDHWLNCHNEAATFPLYERAEESPRVTATSHRGLRSAGLCPPEADRLARYAGLF